METFELQTTLSDELAYLTLFTVGMTRYAKDDWDSAIALFTEALKLAADKASHQVGRDALHSKRAFCHAAKGNLELGDQRLQRVDRTSFGKPELLDRTRCDASA